MALPRNAYLAEARELRELCHAYGVPFVVDDDVALALDCDADGVHVGQGDMPIREVRRHIGASRILGVSASTVGEARAAEQAGADYLGVGAVFPTGSKADATSVSRAELTAICDAVGIPVVAIGGIARDNIEELADTGICGVAVISAIFAQSDIEFAARDLRVRVREELGCMICGAAFDIDGTLLDSTSVWKDLRVRYLASVGVEAEPDLEEHLFALTLDEGVVY
jgi:thiamine-phosphate pyrophosphorylase